MTTTRRTTRLTTNYMARAEQVSAAVAPTKIAAISEEPKKPAKRGYVAVKFTGIDPHTEMMHCTANKPMTIQGEHGASVSIRADERFTAVRAGSLGPDMWYIVRHVSGQKKCSCAANKPCKHEIAVQARQAQPVKVVEGPKKTMVVIDLRPRPVVAAPKIDNASPQIAKNDLGSRGSLNGSRGFSLMR